MCVQLLHAAESGDANRIQQSLADGADANVVALGDRNRTTPLLHAIASSRIKVKASMLSKREESERESR